VKRAPCCRIDGVSLGTVQLPAGTPSSHTTTCLGGVAPTEPVTVPPSAQAFAAMKRTRMGSLRMRVSSTRRREHDHAVAHQRFPPGTRFPRAGAVAESL